VRLLCSAGGHALGRRPAGIMLLHAGTRPARRARPSRLGTGV